MNTFSTWATIILKQSRKKHRTDTKSLKKIKSNRKKSNIAIQIIEKIPI